MCGLAARSGQPHAQVHGSGQCCASHSRPPPKSRAAAHPVPARPAVCAQSGATCRLLACGTRPCQSRSTRYMARPAAAARCISCSQRLHCGSGWAAGAGQAPRQAWERQHPVPVFQQQPDPPGHSRTGRCLDLRPGMAGRSASSHCATRAFTTCSAGEPTRSSMPLVFKPAGKGRQPAQHYQIALPACRGAALCQGCQPCRWACRHAPCVPDMRDR